MARARKNEVETSSVVASNGDGTLRDDEIALDEAFDNLFKALKKWRRHPDRAEERDALMAAYDAREDALHASLEEEEKIGRAAAHVGD